MTVTADFVGFIPRFAEWAASKPQIRRAWVFGSRLKGSQRIDSDLDLALELFRMSEDVLADWPNENTVWLDEIQSLTPYKIQLEFVAGEATPHVHQYLACCSMLVFSRQG